MKHLQFASLALAVIFILFLLSPPQAQAAETGKVVDVVVEDLGNGFISETKLIVYESDTRSSTKAASTVRKITNNGSVIATITLNAQFSYDGSSAKVINTSYSKTLASGWSYTNHNISKSGNRATLNATVKKLLTSLPVYMYIQCSPIGVISMN